MSLRQMSVLELIKSCGSVQIIDNDTCVVGTDRNGHTTYLSHCVTTLRELVVRGFVKNNSGVFSNAN